MLPNLDTERADRIITLLENSEETQFEMYDALTLVNKNLDAGLMLLAEQIGDVVSILEMSNAMSELQHAENTKRAQIEADRADQDRETVKGKNTSGKIEKSDNWFQNLPDPSWFGALISAAIAAYAFGLDKWIREILVVKSIILLTRLVGSFQFLSKTLGGTINGIAAIAKVAFQDHILKGVTTLGRLILSPISFAVDVLKTTTKVVSSIGKLFQPIIKALKPIAAGLHLAKVIPFVNIMFAIIDFVKGFNKGFEDGGLLGGLKEGALEIIRGFVTKPLDLLKDGVAWITRELGWDKFAEALDSFSFTEIFNRLAGAVGDLTGQAFDWVITEIPTIFSNAVDSIESFFKNLKEKIQSFPTMFKEKFIDPITGFFDRIFSSKSVYAEHEPFNLKDLLPTIDIKIPSFQEIMWKVGEAINDVFQSMAEQTHDSFWPINKLSPFFSNAGVRAAEFFGVSNARKFSIFDQQQSQTESLAPRGPLTEKGTAIGRGSKDISNLKEERLSQAVIATTTAVNAPTNVSVRNNKTVSIQGPSPRSTDNSWRLMQLPMFEAR